MRQRYGCPNRISCRGFRLPPKALGNNESQLEVHFQHIGQSTNIVPEIPINAQLHKTYSIYIYNATLWTVDYDATALSVHDGSEIGGASGYSTSDTDDEEEGPSIRGERDLNFRDDWVSMSFNHRPNSVSYAGRRCEHWRLCTEREDQNWARQILPDLYMAQDQTYNQQEGGLIGDLPLLIGLIALAVSDSKVSTVLPQVMQRSWQFSLSNPLSRGDGCKCNPRLKPS